MRNIELLAPAGNFECLKAAVNNGADAVYLGGKNFSARAFANNFAEDELISAVRYAHLHNVRVFVTLNTLLNEKEFSNAIKMADFYYKNQVDALLVQDLGLYYYLKEKYPDFELHCSTQMHVHNLEGVKTARKLGFRRVVLARESTLDFIKAACQEDIEIEVFVHGAICVSYSGQCLMSSITKQRSANKGMCAQCCRLKYELTDEEGKKVKTDTDYLLSPKDMFLLKDIPQLIEAGVSSFKIEGRMKSPAYVGYVTGLYRKAIDSYLKGEEYHVSKQEMDDLKVLFNRNFTNDLLYGRKDLFGQPTPNHLGLEIGQTIAYHYPFVDIRLSSDLHQFDGIRIGESGMILNRLYKNDLLVSEGKAGETVSIRSEENLKGKVYKTLDAGLEEMIARQPEKKLPLKMKITIRASENVRVELSCEKDKYTYTSIEFAQKALKAPLSEEAIIKSFSKINDTIYYLASIEVITDNKAFLPVSVLNEIRRRAIEKFDDHRLAGFKRQPLLPQVKYAEISDETAAGEMIQIDDQIRINEKEFALNYVINKESVYSPLEYGAISEFGGLLQNYKEKIACAGLNCTNSYTYEFLKKMGFDHIILSYELKENEINDLIQACEQRFGKVHPYVLSQGCRTLMYIVSDPFGKYLQKDRNYYLSDGNNTYRISRKGDITELKESEDGIKTVLPEGCQSFIIK